jgi:predicted NBD/HSP70 family sugar kinase
MSSKQQAHKKEILKLLYFERYLSCADLGNSLNKSLPYVTRLIEELIDENLILEKDLAPSTGGRRPIRYSLMPDTFYIISVSMDRLVSQIALFDVENNIIGEIMKLDLVLSKDESSLIELEKYIEHFLEKVSIDRKKIIGIGIGMPGFVDPKNGINYSFMELPKGKSNIAIFLSEKLQMPVFIDNDSSLIALAEFRFGHAVKHENVMVVNIGWGVGLGMIIDGKMYRGNLGFSGEFSHIPLFTNNKLCSCGKRGCLETETSLLVLIEKIKEAKENGRVSILNNISNENPEEVFNLVIKAVAEGDQLAIELISEIAYKIGRGLSILVHLMNPELIILSGRGSLAGHIWLAPIQQALNEYCIPKLLQKTKLEISELGFNAELIGATALVMDNFVEI